ncbi:hypothetical protein [Kordiimonas marina]|uniref:hypothetical protein n=1 Tax=Kordiimonas marina TaxID=2872312 RepID=UPI001FF20970|nr:hypothetical protein [Kordiimonas marina]MCJ9427488.1 hypothetical protein [Kordiimonas marina]
MSVFTAEFNQATPLDLSGAANQLGFLLGQLDGSKVEAIAAKVERLADVADVDHGTAPDGEEAALPIHARVQQAIARILYAVAGMSYEDRVFALTYAEIQAVLDGANDECYETPYCQ